uniref:Alpha-2-macroglobulin domain-containing protein n=1 Tax=Astyanax mexicanus TaxID=7994 RepID=A0A8B9L5Q4_ASTMX
MTSSFQTYDQQDPNSNRIGQWLNQSTFSGILDLSYPLNSEAQHGFYIITVWNEKNDQITQDFEINEYVLPTFEVIVQLPPVITILDTEATLKVCGNYTYGKPVNGSVIAVVCRKHYVWWWFGYDSKLDLDICKTYSMTTDKAGCGSAVLNLEEYALTATEYEDVINVEAQLEEAGTGKSFSVSVCLKLKLHILYIITALFHLICCYTGGLNSFSFLIVNKGTLTIQLEHVKNMAPFAQVVVYTILPNGEAVADSRDFAVDLCLTNQVSLIFPSPTELPGGQTSLILKAQPGSLCSVKAIDRSLLLLKPEKDKCYIFLTKAAVAAMDAPLEFGAPMLLAKEADVAAPDVAVQSDQTIRTYFPETWIWDLVPVGKSGIMGVKKTVPDTITTWSARAFCMSAVGFGIAPKAELTTFQPFFVSLTLPYSIIRGEVLPLKATVFNYLSGCIMVNVMLAHSEQFTAQQCERCIYTRCLCADESWTFKWTVQASALGKLCVFNVSAEALQTNVLCGSSSVTVPEKGRMDTVVQTLLVKAEGTNLYFEKQKTQKTPLPACRIEPLAQELHLLSTGDLMGRALKNLQSLLAMPYGCGEQNMLLFAPNIFILLYLESSGQLTPEIRSKATTFLVSGYQRELIYKHDDGSYSAFGMSDPSGNTWLTAFVMKSFSSAMKYIFVDQQYVDKAKDWLGLQQQENGCFASVGQLFHSDMKGGVSDELTLTAYITAAMLELGTPVSDPVVEKSLTCLKSNFTQLNSTYSTALLSYAFTLAEDHQMRLESLNILDEQAIVTAGGRHWSRLNDGKTLDSLEVEMTSYVLLSILSGPQLQGFDLGYCASIVRWLAQQQNAFGGFASTQDTVVALQALAKYSAVTYSPAGTTVVTVTGPSGNTLTTFTVNQSNRLLVQESSLQQTSGNYSIRAEGNGCVLVQVSYSESVESDSQSSKLYFSTIKQACFEFVHIFISFISTQHLIQKRSWLVQKCLSIPQATLFVACTKIQFLLVQSVLNR